MEKQDELRRLRRCSHLEMNHSHKHSNRPLYSALTNAKSTQCHSAIRLILLAKTHPKPIGLYEQGNVKQIMDRQLRKNVYSIRGSIAARNFIRIPRYYLNSNHQ